jgi:hypothetical protein
MFPVHSQTISKEFKGLTEQNFQKEILSKYLSEQNCLAYEGLINWMVSVINDKGHNFVRDGLFRMGYDRKTLRPFRTRRFNISFHSKNLEES